MKVNIQYGTRINARPVIHLGEEKLRFFHSGTRFIFRNRHIYFKIDKNKADFTTWEKHTENEIIRWNKYKRHVFEIDGKKYTVGDYLPDILGHGICESNGKWWCIQSKVPKMLDWGDKLTQEESKIITYIKKLMKATDFGSHSLFRHQLGRTKDGQIVIIDFAL